MDLNSLFRTDRFLNNGEVEAYYSRVHYYPLLLKHIFGSKTKDV